MNNGDASPIFMGFVYKINEILADVLHYHQTQLAGKSPNQREVYSWENIIFK